MRGTRCWGIVCVLSLIVLGAGCGSGSGMDTESSAVPDSYVLYDPADAEASGLSDVELSVSLAVSGALAQFASGSGNFETMTIVIQPISIVDVDPIEAPWCGHCGVEPVDPSAPVVSPVAKDLTYDFRPVPIEITIEPILDPGVIEAPWCGHCGPSIFKDVSVSPRAVSVTAMPVIDEIEAPWCGHCGTPFDFILTPDDVNPVVTKDLVSGSSVLSTTVTPLSSEVDILAPWCGHCSPIDIILVPRDILNPVVSKDVESAVDLVDMGIVVAPLE